MSSAKCTPPNGGAGRYIGENEKNLHRLQGAELMKETLDLLNLEITVEPDPLHGYGEIPIIGFQEQIALGELRSGGPRRHYENLAVVRFRIEVAA